MQITSGTVVDGKIVMEGDALPEGTVVTILARDSDETFSVPPELDAELLESMEEADRGDTLTAAEVLRPASQRLMGVFAVEVTPRAFAQLTAPDAVINDFEQAKDILANQPEIGARSSSTRYPELRRLYIARIRYHVYYRVDRDKVIVLAFWHASRGSGPSI